MIDVKFKSRDVGWTTPACAACEAVALEHAEPQSKVRFAKGPPTGTPRAYDDWCILSVCKRDKGFEGCRPTTKAPVVRFL